MAVKAGSFTPNGTGDVTINNISFLPTEIQLRIGSSFGTIDTDKISYSEGWSTAANQSYDSFFRDNKGPAQDGGTGKCLRLFRRNPTTNSIEDALVAIFVDFHTLNPTNHGFTLNLPVNLGGKQIRFKVSDA